MNGDKFILIAQSLLENQQIEKWPVSLDKIEATRSEINQLCKENIVVELPISGKESLYSAGQVLLDSEATLLNLNSPYVM